VVSAFVGGSLERILALQPDLVIGFSDVQAEWARTLISAGLPVLIFNQRTVQEILEVMLTLSRIVGAEGRGQALVDGWLRGLDQAAARAAARGPGPRVYFEEWNDPMISAIGWVSELITVVGGQNVFADRAHQAASKDRVTTVEEVQDRAPEVMLASWCGKPFVVEEASARLGPGVPAVAAGRLHEVPSEIILQPGPACLTDGVRWLESLIHEGIPPMNAGEGA
jgi:iron complex transport system substrate-binding protein